MPLYEFECKECQIVFDDVRNIADRYKALCPMCGQSAEQRITPPRGIKKFPEGIFHGLPDEPYISSKRQLREEVNRFNDSRGDMDQVYSKYDDGYA